MRGVATSRIAMSLLVVALASAACTNSNSTDMAGSSGAASSEASTASVSPQPSTESTPTATPTPTPTPTSTGPIELTVEEAGAIYLEQACAATTIERKYQAVRERNDPYPGSDAEPSRRTKRAAQKAADANEAMALALANPSVSWPAGIRREIRDVAAWEYDIASHYLEIVQATSWADVGPYPRLKNRDAPATIRLALALPPPGQCE